MDRNDETSPFIHRGKTPLKRNLEELNVVNECKKYNLNLWQCPSFLFIIMGTITIVGMLSTYFIADKYTEQPEIVALIVIIVTTIIFVIGQLIVKNFEELANANKMKTEFVSIVSHQLRTPLTSVKWSIDLMKRGQIGHQVVPINEFLGNMQESNERMIKLVNDLLDVSRIEMGRIVLRPRSISIEEVAKDVAGDLESLAKASNVVINIKPTTNLSKVYADPERLHLIFQNLIDNSVKYIGHKGKVDIILEKSKDYIKVSIFDDGVGIPENQQKFIFQKFFRSDNVVKRQTVGSGLGLYITKATIEAMGGKIGFWSQESVGTTFWFTVPTCDSVPSCKEREEKENINP